MGCAFKPVEMEEIYSIVRSFEGGKAQDIHGLSAEHLKYAVEVIAFPLATLMNFILKTGPEVIKLFLCSTQLSMKFQMLISIKLSRNSAFLRLS